MKILQIISGYDVNGAMVHCKLLSTELARRGHDVTVMCRGGSWIWRQFELAPVRLVVNHMDRWPPQRFLRTSQWIKREGFDVIHTHMSRAHMYGILLKYFTGVPVVATAHNRYLQLHWKLNDLVIANSEATRRYHCRVNRIRPDQIKTIRCFVELDRFQDIGPHWRTGLRKSWRMNEDQKIIGIIGDVTERKGHSYLFKALPQLIKKFPDLRVIVVGIFHRRERYAQKLRRFLLANNLAGRVKWLGRRNDIPQIISALDLLVVPSLEEPLGLVPMEAMACGTPVATSDSGGLPEVVTHRETGLIFPSKSVEAIAQSVEYALTNPDQMNQMRDTARRWVVDMFSPQALSSQIEDTLRQAAMSRAA